MRLNWWRLQQVYLQVHVSGSSVLLGAGMGWGQGVITNIANNILISFCSRYNEFYFLTHPALFINNHFPDNNNWQLLKPTVALKQFENNMLYKSDFYKMGLMVAHPETSIIQTGTIIQLLAHASIIRYFQLLEEKKITAKFKTEGDF